MSPFSPDSSRITDALRDPLSDLGLDLEAVEAMWVGIALMGIAVIARWLGPRPGRRPPAED